jgi:hypothetical protein
MRSPRFVLAVILAAGGVAAWLTAPRAVAHCDTMDGPIVPEARRALDSGDVRPLLKWVRERDEAAIRSAFARARALRERGPDVREMADQFFLETLIRIHRAGEGEPFTGLKPAGSAPPIFKVADEALDAGSVDALADELADSIRREIKDRFDAARHRRERADDSVDAGRAYVEAYVGYMHFVEGIHGFLEHAAAEGHAGTGHPAARDHGAGGHAHEH